MTGLQRREAAVDRQDAALAAHPDRQGPEFVAELEAVVRELEALANDARAFPGDPVEQSRTWSSLGGAYYDLGAPRDPALLQKSVRAYERAEALLDGVDAPLVRAKLDFNFANTLRALGAIGDTDKFREALLRYDRAAEAFARLAPELAPRARQAAAPIRTLFAVRGQYETAQGNVQRMQELQRRLAAATTKEEREAIREDLKAIGSPAAMAWTVNESLEALQRDMPGAGDLAGIKAKLQGIGAAEPRSKADLMRHVAGVLRARAAAELKEGKMDPARRAAIEAILGKIEALAAEPDAEIPDIAAFLSRLRGDAESVIALLATPRAGGEGPKAIARRRTAALNAVVASEGMQPGCGSVERRQVEALLRRLAKVEQQLEAAEDTREAVQRFEAEAIRQLAVDVADYAHRHNLALCSPLWPCPPLARNPNGVAFVGGDETRAVVQRAAKELSLQLCPPRQGRDATLALWDDLRGCAVAAFDLGEPPGPRLAEVSFGLGMALALGRPIAVLAPPGADVPFDIEVAPVLLRGDVTAAVRDALEAALYSARRLEAESSVRETAEYVLRRLDDPALAEGPRLLLEQLKGADDAAVVTGLIESFLSETRNRTEVLLHPAWPATYPAPGARRCFHVMPFRPSWAAEVSKRAEDACERTLGAEYVRGDRVSDVRVVRSIWNELCRATHVLVDLTDFNPNVALELALAQALGRKTLVVSRANLTKELPPSLRHLRVHVYAEEPSWGERLEKLLATQLFGEARR